MVPSGSSLQLLLWFVAALAIAALAVMAVMTLLAKIYVASPADDEPASSTEAVIITVPGLLRIFRALVITATAVGLFLYTWQYLPLSLAPSTKDILDLGGALAISPAASSLGLLVAQPIWILSAVGLCFFRPWSRPLFVGVYVFTTITNLLGGVIVWLPWELTLFTIATLLDGAVFALAFLPPLARYFRSKRANTSGISEA